MGRRGIDHTGKRFGRWTALVRGSNLHAGGTIMHPTMQTTWLCECDCGTMRAVRTVHLTSGKSTSCGCIAQEKRDEKLKILTAKLEAERNKQH